VPADQILDRATDDVVEPRTPVRGRGAFVEHERLAAGVRRQRLAEEVFLAPRGEDALLDVEKALGELWVVHV
jgi:hypothetical protein